MNGGRSHVFSCPLFLYRLYRYYGNCFQESPYDYNHFEWSPSTMPSRAGLLRRGNPANFGRIEG
jgi:hypothetical protein